MDPIKLLVDLDQGRTYLRGWCRLAEGVRNFRLDRVLDVEVLDLPAEVHEEEESFDGVGGLFRPSEADVRVGARARAPARAGSRSTTRASR